MAFPQINVVAQQEDVGIYLEKMDSNYNKHDYSTFEIKNIVTWNKMNSRDLSIVSPFSYNCKRLRVSRHE